MTGPTNGLVALLTGACEPGIFRWAEATSLDEVRRTVEAGGSSFAHLDGAGLTSREKFLVGIGEALGFPDYYGRNFDAMLDCLRDLGTYPDDDSTGGMVLLWDGWGGFAREDQKAFSIALAVLSQRVDEREAGRFSVLLRGPGPELADVPSLADLPTLT